MAAKKPFEGELKVNGAPIEFNAKKKNGRYRNIPLFRIGEGSEGIPAECDGSPETLVLEYGDLDVERDQTIKEDDDFLFIKAEFKSSEVLKGTLRVDGEGQGATCTSDGKLEFKATLVS